jgi:hypothetical protein
MPPDYRDVDPRELRVLWDIEDEELLRVIERHIADLTGRQSIIA